MEPLPKRCLTCCDNLEPGYALSRCVWCQEQVDRLWEESLRRNPKDLSLYEWTAIQERIDQDVAMAARPKRPMVTRKISAAESAAVRRVGRRKAGPK